MRSDEPFTDVAGFMFSAAFVASLTQVQTDTHLFSCNNTFVQHFIGISSSFALFAIKTKIL